jgi:hypothetical protein
MKGEALRPSFTHAAGRLEILHALQDARRCCDQTGAPATGAPAGRGLSRRQQLQVSRALSRASVRAAWPLPARLARLLSPRSPGSFGSAGSPGLTAQRSELEALLVTAAAAVRRLSPHPAALGAAVELLDVVATLERTDTTGDRPEPLSAR